MRYPTKTTERHLQFSPMDEKYLDCYFTTWWCHDIETLSALPIICEGNPLVIGGFHPVNASNMGLDAYFVVSLNKWFDKQSSCWWFKTSCCSSDTVTDKVYVYKVHRQLFCCTQLYLYCVFLNMRCKKTYPVPHEPVELSLQNKFYSYTQWQEKHN